MTKNVRKKCHLLAQKSFAAANRHVQKDDPINNLLSGPHLARIGSVTFWNCRDCEENPIWQIFLLHFWRKTADISNIRYLLCMVGCNWQYWVFAKLSSTIGQHWAGLRYFCALTYLDKCNAATQVLFVAGGLFLEYFQTASVSLGTTTTLKYNTFSKKDNKHSVGGVGGVC